MATQSDIDNITALFLTKQEDMPRISTRTDKPTYLSIKKFHDRLQENAMAVPSFTTDLGHLALVIPANEFTEANEGDVFVPPLNPGLSPTMPTFTSATLPAQPAITRTGAAAAAAIPTANVDHAAQNQFLTSDAIRTHQLTLAAFTTFRTTRTALRNSILNAVDEKYITTLKHARTGFATVTPLTLLTYLWSTYGKVDTSDLTANETCMKAPWHPPTSIETLFEQLLDGQAMAKRGGEEIRVPTLIRYGYELIHATGLFDRDCAKWRKFTTAEKTWEYFVEYFTVAEDDRSKNTTAAEAKYTANEVQSIVQQELAAFVFNDENSNPNTPPTQKPAPVPATESANSITLEKILQALQSNAANNNSNNNNSNNNRRKKPYNDTSAKTHFKAQSLHDGVPVTYCWSHGITQNLSHTSSNCSRQREGHQADATYDNRKGGNNERQKSRSFART